MSTEKVPVLFASDPSTLKFPVASENLLLATLTTLGVVLLAPNGLTSVLQRLQRKSQP